MAWSGILKRIGRRLMWKRIALRRIASALDAIPDFTLHQYARTLQSEARNPLNRFGKKCFSQTDEDGITLEILRRIGGMAGGTYAEIGVGDGLENNTLILAAMGWKGFWIGGETLKPRHDKAGGRFVYLQHWVTLENINALFADGMAGIRSESIDVVSLDLDGNDIYLLQALLSAHVAPKLFIVEYNAKFPPPVEFQIAYDAQHRWQGDDYFGASLSSFVKVFDGFDYRLVCCNAHSGANAFFIRNDFLPLFADVPPDIDSIYVEPRYWLYQKFGHPPSVRTVERILNGP